MGAYPQIKLQLDMLLRHHMGRSFRYAISKKGTHREIPILHWNHIQCITHIIKRSTNSVDLAYTSFDNKEFVFCESDNTFSAKHMQICAIDIALHGHEIIGGSQECNWIGSEQR